MAKPGAVPKNACGPRDIITAYMKRMILSVLLVAIVLIVAILAYLSATKRAEAPAPREKGGAAPLPTSSSGTMPSFRGPVGAPHIQGPSGPPPAY